MTFKDLGLIAPILRALADEGYEKPSPIQAKAIPPALEGRDVLGCAQTGTGKTCAFAAPILQRLSAAPARQKPRPVRALILTPTRELALQIQESFEHYGKNLPLRSAVIFGGVGQGPQVEQLKRGVDVLVATPGRLEDLHSQGFIYVENLEIFVLDEADRMLDMGFIHDVRKILKWLPAKKQTLFFSATMPPEVQGLVDSLLHNPAKVAVDPISSPVEIIDQRLYYVDRGNKTKLLSTLIRDGHVRNALIFTRTKHGANKVAGDLVKAGISAAAIHGNKSQTARQQALADFKAGRITALVATDIAARGLDIEELSHVFNYNLPDVPETYVHRIGRTGRAGHGGTAVSFCDINEKDALRSIEKLIGRHIPVVDGHPWPMQILEPSGKDAKGRPVNPEDAEARAAAKEHRRARNAEAAAKKAAPAPQQQKPVPAAPPPEAPAKPRRRRGQRASATLEAALTATSPAIPAARQAYTDFEKPNPLASDVIMDATARLLAPRRPTAAASASKPAEPPRPSAGESGKKRRRGKKKTSGESPAAEALIPKKASGAPAPKKKSGGRGPGRGVRGGPPEIRRGTQKDSTEQPSLMRPYYLSDDN